MSQWDKPPDVEQLGETIEEEFNLLMRGFPTRGPAYREAAQKFFACGAMAALSLAVMRMTKQPERVAEIVRELADECRNFIGE